MERNLRAIYLRSIYGDLKIYFCFKENKVLYIPSRNIK